MRKKEFIFESNDGDGQSVLVSEGKKIKVSSSAETEEKGRERWTGAGSFF